MTATSFDELIALERIIERGSGVFDVRTLCSVECDGRRFPVHALAVGTPDPRAPAVGFFAGVHGLERIGTRVLLAFLETLLERAAWDPAQKALLGSMRLVFVPLVNPAGMHRRTRCNAAGVDLMRNAPVESEEAVAPMVGGHRLSRRLPWYRGARAMEPETRAVCELVREELFGRPLSLVLDCHSGFGFRDRIWFPYACSRRPIPHLGELFALQQLFERAHPHHDYTFEPQSRQYLTHGDLWDYLYQQAAAESPSTVFLPMTLEMGSWRWIRKNPLQLASREGYFNPFPAHRLQRVLRRHHVWLDFLTRAAAAGERWLPDGSARAASERLALARWYGGAP
ncbi:M14 family zinc carboxypeptidase [Noviherbaspirillum aridicola]|uniref:Peptidase M14 n=1 Tax=Noviherbaspirillum aridicola TaxID=2849687 RepID=A0ABQ4Q7Q3_9BURK|nr:M14 family zinc carboxypeptidase [Noviherbaspirillum aridicola]GIZ52810.1 peptidase M14 [Noviherbaspirillum aridicola]